MRRFLSIAFGFIVLSGILYLGSRVFLPSKNYLTAQVSAALDKPLTLTESLFNKGQESELNSLTLENEQLKAKILELEKSPYLLQTENHDYLVAKIYSTYPFNNRGLFTINAGFKNGVKTGLAVTFEKHILIGQITEVYENYSLVRSIFDGGWELPVKIDSDNIDALLVGGREPKLTLIVKGEEIKPGQPVYAAGRDFPYGLKIGEINEVFTDLGKTFEEGTVSFAYEIGTLTEIAVLIR